MSKPSLDIEFDPRNLRPSEKILFTCKPNRFHYLWHNFFFGKIPFFIALIWAVIDFGIMFGVPAQTGEYWILGILIPFMAVHGMPIWIWIHGVVTGAKSYRTVGYIVTNERFIARTNYRKPVEEYEIPYIMSLTVTNTNRLHNATLHINYQGSARDTIVTF
ncbi:MAG: hypothetical protein LBR37_00210 [Erysipelotrichaceae bacterium]|nr:hypothetical protein [Erysipelotrichaceae bacterium]